MSVIDPAVRTSRLIPAALALKAALEAVAWPAHPDTGTTPKVVALAESDYVEQVVVLPGDDNDAFAEWAHGGPATRNEEITIPVWIKIATPLNFDDEGVLRRLEALHVAAAGVAYDVPAGKPKPVGFGNEIASGYVRSLTVSTAEAADRIVARARLEFVMRARI